MAEAFRRAPTHVVSPFEFFRLIWATLIGIFMVGLLEHRDKTIFKMGYDSAAVILMFAVGLGVLATI